MCLKNYVYKLLCDRSIIIEMWISQVVKVNQMCGFINLHFGAATSVGSWTPDLFISNCRLTSVVRYEVYKCNVISVVIKIETSGTSSEVLSYEELVMCAVCAIPYLHSGGSPCSLFTDIKALKMFIVNTMELRSSRILIFICSIQLDSFQIKWLWIVE